MILRTAARSLPPVVALLVACVCAESASAAARLDAEPSAVEEPAKPADDEPRGLRHREDGAFDGYTLIAPLNSHAIHLVGMDGAVVHTWNTGQAPAGGTYLLDNGRLLRCARRPDNPRFQGGGIGGWIHELDWDGKVVWEYELAGADRTAHHDVALLPNGNVLVIAWEYHSPEEAAARGRDARFVDAKGIWPDVILEVEPVRPAGGKVVWTWRAWDHLVQDRDPKLPGYGKPSDHPGRIDINADHRFLPAEETDEERERREKREEQMRAVGYAGDDPADAKPDKPEKRGHRISADWLHTNSVAHLPEHDLIVLSTPRMSEVWVIDHSTTSAEAAGSTGGRWGRGGELLYRWGNPRNYGIGGAAQQTLFDQHDATWLRGETPGELRLLVFNNNEGPPERQHSAVDEIVLPFDPERGFVREPGRAFGPERAAWKYTQPGKFHSGFISGAQRLPNGNTLVCEGAKGRVFEVRRDGHIVWDFWNPLGGEIEPSPQGGKAPPKALFRATRIAKDDPALKGRF